MRNQFLDVRCIPLPHLFNINTSIARNKLQVEFSNMLSCDRSLLIYSVFTGEGFPQSQVEYITTSIA